MPERISARRKNSRRQSIWEFAEPLLIAPKKAYDDGHPDLETVFQVATRICAFIPAGLPIPEPYCGLVHVILQCIVLYASLFGFMYLFCFIVEALFGRLVLSLLVCNGVWVLQCIQWLNDPRSAARSLNAACEQQQQPVQEVTQEREEPVKCENDGFDFGYELVKEPLPAASDELIGRRWTLGPSHHINRRGIH